MITSKEDNTNDINIKQTRNSSLKVSPKNKEDKLTKINEFLNEMEETNSESGNYELLTLIFL